MMLLQVGVVSDYDLLALDSISGTISVMKPLYFPVLAKLVVVLRSLTKLFLGDLVTFSSRATDEYLCSEKATCTIISMWLHVW